MSALLTCRGLTRRFGGVTALDGLDLDVTRGEILGLIGPNGSGKTTFFNVLTGIYAPSAGRIEFEGRDITGGAPQQVYRAGVARTFQRSRMNLELSIFENIMIGNHKRLNAGLWFNLLQRRALADEVARAYAQTRELVQTFDAPLADRLDEPMAGFSMIDRRRVEVCRALISQPKLLLLDEPSAGMTHEETRALMDDILQARERIAGLTIIIVEHEMGVIERITDRCVVLNFGQKIAEGKYREVAKDAKVQAAYLGVVEGEGVKA